MIEIEKEKLIYFVVPVYGTGGIWLPRCLDSLLDNQDWSNKKVVVVFDGKKKQSKTALAQEEEYKDDERISFIHLEKNKGAPAARNAGLDYVQSSGGCDYICFFDCDSVLVAGGIRSWMVAFDENPDCGFVYNGYRFKGNKGMYSYIPAKPFNRWLLTCNNYISTMNPVKFDHCVRWDEDLKALQDWDFWLRITGAGVKGHYLKDYNVITEEPDSDSVSGKGNRDWLKIFKAVRDKNGIKDRKVAFSTTGAEFQSIRRAKFMDADYRDAQMLIGKPHHYDAIVSMGYYVDSPNGPFSVFANGNGSKKIIHFIGTDVLQLSCRKYLEVKAFGKYHNKTMNKMFSNAPWLQEELSEMGVETELLYCPIDPSPYTVLPLPKKFTLAYYYSDSNPVHNWNFMVDLAVKTPDILWKFFGGNKKEFKDLPDNIEIMGKIPEPEMPSFIASTSAIIRLTIHDGFPATLAEWAMSCRPIICNLEKMPFARYIPIGHVSRETYTQYMELSVREVRKLQANIHKDHVMRECLKSRHYYIKLLSPEKYIKRMNEVCYEKV